MRVTVLALQELKSHLLRAGFEIYRAREDVVTIAERPRENLVMDSGVRVTLRPDGYVLRFVTRAERSAFPGEPDGAMFERARDVLRRSVVRAFDEVEATARTIQDPGDEAHTLDTWFEVVWETLLVDEATLLEQVAFLMKLEKAATR